MILSGSFIMSVRKEAQSPEAQNRQLVSSKGNQASLYPLAWVLTFPAPLHTNCVPTFSKTVTWSHSRRGDTQLGFIHMGSTVMGIYL